MKKFVYKKLYRKIVSLVLIISICGTYNVYAKTAEPEFVDKPESNDSKKEGHVDAIIYDKQKALRAKNPLNPNPTTKDEEEKKLYDTFVIDINTIPKRVEYFSPTYVYATSAAKNSILGNLAIRGVSPQSSQEMNYLVGEYKDNRREVRDGIKTATSGLNTLVKSLRASGMSEQAIQNVPEVINLKSQISLLNVTELTLSGAIKSYNSVIGTFNYSMNMVNRAPQIAGLGSTKDMLIKSMISAFLGYKQLEYYEKLLSEQVDMYQRIYYLTLCSRDIGASTELDVTRSKLSLDTTMDSYNSIKAQKDNVESQLLVNLGYDMKDKNKITYVEPDIDFASIVTINPSDDYEHAYNSNKTYQGVYQEVQSYKNRGDDYAMNIYSKYRDEYKQKTIASLDDYYAKLKHALEVYQATLPTMEAYNLDVQNAMTMKQQGLVSEAEGIGLDIKNLATELNIIQTKYNLITSYYDYYYATYGIGT